MLVCDLYETKGYVISVLHTCLPWTSLETARGHRTDFRVNELLKSTLFPFLLDFRILFRIINFVYSVEIKESSLGVCRHVYSRQHRTNSLYSLQMPLFALNLDKHPSLREEHIGTFICNSQLNRIV